MIRLAKATAVFVLVLNAAAGTALGGEETAPALVVVDTVREVPMTGTAAVIGRLVPRQSGVVAARIRGPVDKVQVDVGDRVEKGQVLAVLVDDRLKADRDFAAAELSESKARLTTAKASLELARQELKRLKALRKSAAFSQARFDDKRQEMIKLESQVAEAKAGLAQARANLRRTEIDLYNTKIRAPFPGVVTLRRVAAGAYLNVGDDVVTLINDRDLEIEADVSSSYLKAIPPGTAVTVGLSGGKDAKAVVRAIVPDENPRTRTRAVRFTPKFDPAELGLAANENVVLNLPVSKAREVVSVDKDAVINRQGLTFVFIVKGDLVQPRPVRLGKAVGNRFEVISGLAPGDLVVVRGNERLQPGQKVRFEGHS